MHQKLLKFHLFYKIFLICSFILLSYTYSYSQQHSRVYATASDMQRDNVTTAVVPNNVAFQMSGFFPGGDYEGIGIGGGLAVEYRHNFNRYVGIGTNIGYTYTSKDDYTAEYNGVEYTYRNKAHFVDGRLFLTIQRETALGEEGFVPWFLLGVSLDLGILESSGNGIDFIGLGGGFLIGAGVKYNFEKFYVGGGINYQFAFLEGWKDMDTEKYGYNLDPSGLRFYAEVGLRM